jgi:hypothetical protein
VPVFVEEVYGSVFGRHGGDPLLRMKADWRAKSLLKPL